MTIDEIFKSMPDEAAAGGHEFLIIDPETRSITVPEAERIFGVTGDELADRKYFMCPRYVGDGLDLAGMFIRVNYRNAGGDEDGYLVDDVTVAGDYVTFSWRLWPKVTEYKGAIQFSVCADLPNTAERRFPDWNTTTASGEVLEGLHPYDGDVEEETRDVVTQLREMVTAQTEAVEATGADQVQAVRAASVTAAADAQAQIEAKGAATLATIPADYTTLANKTNEQANAIKGHLAGEIVQAGDVSPVEHYLAVKAHGKNLFNTGKFMPAEDQTESIYVSAVEAGAITLYCSAEHNGYYSTGLRLREVCNSLEIGKTYTLSASTEATGREYMYLHGANVTWWYGKPQTMTEEMLNSTIVLYSINGKNNGAGYCTISNIQIEEGTEATEYTPYIDPAGVTVTRCGKNILGYSDDFEITQDGLTISYDAETRTFTVNGTPTSASFSINFGSHLFDTFAIPIGTEVTLSIERLSGTLTAESATNVFYLGNSDEPGGGRNNWFSVPFPMSGKKENTSAATRKYFNRTWLYIGGENGVTFTDYKFRVQLEIGGAATAYEEFAGAKHTPDNAGAASGILSQAPAMTLLTDKAGVKIECTYNRDSNAVYAELLAKIAALSGAN